MSWLQIIVFIVLGFVALGKGADWLVGGATVIARRLGVGALVVGLTVVAWGTSLPEVVVSTMSAMRGSAAISLGTSLGSNIANIGLVLGVCALVLPAVLEVRLAGREIFWLLFSIGLLCVLSLDGHLGRLEGLLLLGVFALQTFDVFRQARKQSQLANGQSLGEDLEVLEHIAERAVHWTRHPLLETLVGMLSIALGAWLVVEGAKGGAAQLGVDKRVVALTVVAIGTSLPELAAGLGGALKGEKDISVGNVVGSNVFNVLAVIGITAVVHPLGSDYELAHGQAAAAAEVASAFAGAKSLDFPIAIAFSLFVVALPLLGGRRHGRAKGAVLVAAYAGYLIWLYFSGRPIS